MDEPFIITVTHKGKPLELETNFERRGYTYRFKIAWNNTDIYFEKDEEGNLRGIVDHNNDPKPDKELMEVIAAEIDRIIS